MGFFIFENKFGSFDVMYLHLCNNTAYMKLQYSSERMAKAVKTKRIIELDIETREAAKKIGISSATLSRIENNKTPDVNTLASLCKWLGLGMESFFLPAKKKSSNKTKK